MIGGVGVNGKLEVAGAVDDLAAGAVNGLIVGVVALSTGDLSKVGISGIVGFRSGFLVSSLGNSGLLSADLVGLELEAGGVGITGFSIIGLTVISLGDSFFKSGFISGLSGLSGLVVDDVVVAHTSQLSERQTRNFACVTNTLSGAPMASNCSWTVLLV